MNWLNNLRSLREGALLEGKLFSGGILFSAVAAGASVYARLYVPAGGSCLADAFVEASGECLVTPYQDTTYTNDGTPIVMRNRNLLSGLTAHSQAYSAPTINVLGTAGAPILVEGSSGGGPRSARVGAEASSDFGFVLGGNSGNDILLKIDNLSGAAADVVVRFTCADMS